MADATQTAPSNANLNLRIKEEDWNSMCDRRDNLDKDIDDAIKRRSLRMVVIAIDERAGLSKQLIKAHNMRERDTLASYRKRVDELKAELEKELEDAKQAAGATGGQQANA